jgi:cyclopropane fatty-acyl-phospholipid synthase-like methyltransferase
MTEWFEEWFGEEYLRLYPHRDDADAERAVALIGRTVGLEAGWRVLDVACGAGRHARAFTDAGASCFGLCSGSPARSPTLH